MCISLSMFIRWTSHILQCSYNSQRNNSHLAWILSQKLSFHDPPCAPSPVCAHFVPANHDPVLQKNKHKQAYVQTCPNTSTAKCLHSMHSLYTALLLAQHSGSHKADHLHGPAKHWDIVTSSHSVILSHSESVWSVEIYRIYLLSPLRPICTLLSHFQGSTETTLPLRTTCNSLRFFRTFQRLNMTFPTANWIALASLASLPSMSFPCALRGSPAGKDSSPPFGESSWCFQPLFGERSLLNLRVDGSTPRQMVCHAMPTLIVDCLFCLILAQLSSCLDWPAPFTCQWSTQHHDSQHLEQF